MRNQISQPYMVLSTPHPIWRQATNQAHQAHSLSGLPKCVGRAPNDWPIFLGQKGSFFQIHSPPLVDLADAFCSGRWKKLQGNVGRLTRVCVVRGNRAPHRASGGARAHARGAKPYAGGFREGKTAVGGHSGRFNGEVVGEDWRVGPL